MSIGSIAIGAAILLLTTAFVTGPLRRGDVVGNTSLGNVVKGDAQRGVLSALRALDFDHELGKIGAEDYAFQRSGLLLQASQLFKMEQDQDAQLEAMIEAHKKKRSAPFGNYCPGCGNLVDPGDRYCASCGLSNFGTCPSCGEKVVPEQRFCSSCGKNLAD